MELRALYIGVLYGPAYSPKIGVSRNAGPGAHAQKHRDAGPGAHAHAATIDIDKYCQILKKLVCFINSL